MSELRRHFDDTGTQPMGSWLSKAVHAVAPVVEPVLNVVAPEVGIPLTVATNTLWPAQRSAAQPGQRVNVSPALAPVQSSEWIAGVSNEVVFLGGVAFVGLAILTLRK